MINGGLLMTCAPRQGRRASRVSALALCLPLLACSGTDEQTANATIEAAAPAPPLRRPGPAGRPQLSPSVDLQAVVERIHFAFRPDTDGAHSGGHATYTSRVDKSGALTVRPYRRTHKEEIAGAALRLETRSIKRGAVELTTRQPRISAAEGGLILDRGGAVEHLRNTAAGVQQSWRFAAPPAGAGDLVIRVSVSGAAYRGHTAKGLHFAAHADGLGLRYGHATWIDAAGRRSALRVHRHAGAMELRVPGALLASSRYPALLDPFISPELGLDNPTNGPANGTQWRPTMAFDGANFLVAWDDVRLGTDGDIYGTRISKAGVVIDPTGIVISDASGYQGRTSVAFDGTNFLVVWEDYRGSDVDVYGARVSKTGVVLEPSGIPIAASASAQYAPHASHDGSNFIVVWPDGRNGANLDIYLARISAAGVVLDKSGIQVSTSTGDAAEPVALYNGANILVVWNDERGSTDKDIYAARVTKAGVLLDSAGVAVCTAPGDQEAPQVALSGTTAMTVWYDRRGADANIYAARITAAGAVLDSNGFAVTTAKGDQTWPSIGHDGAGYLVAWQDRRSGSSHDIYASRVSAAGAVLDTAGVAISTAAGDQTRPFVGFDGAQYMLGWTDGRNGQDDIYTSRVSSAAAVLDPLGLLISKAGNMQLNPTTAFDGSNYLVVWQDNRAGTSLDLWGARLSMSAKVLDPIGIAVTKATGDQADPAVAFDGTNFLVVWRDERSGSGADIYGARISKAGAVLDGAGVAICAASGDQLRPVVTHDGANFLVAWQDGRGSSGSDVYAARVSAAGALLDAAGITVSVAGGDQLHPAVAAGGAAALVVWEDKRSSKTVQIYGARVTSAGGVLDTAGIPITQTGVDQRRPAVAHDGAAYRVVWHGAQGGGVDDALSVRIDGSSGKILDTTPLVLSSVVDPASRLALCPDKSGNILAVWQEFGSDGTFSIHGIRVKGSALLSSSTFKIVGGTWSSEDEEGLALSGTGSNQHMLAYTRFDDAVTQRTPRIRALLLTWKLDGAACSHNDDCATGFCVDGVCCGTSCGDSSNSDCQVCSKAAGAATDGTCGPVGAGAACRAATEACDLPESCDGTSLACPADSFKPSKEVCRKAAHPCDAQETCTGSGPGCPVDLFQADGTPCQGTSGQCSKGTCVPLSDAGPLGDGTTRDQAGSDARAPSSRWPWPWAGPPAATQIHPLVTPPQTRVTQPRMQRPRTPAAAGLTSRLTWIAPIPAPWTERPSRPS